MSVRKSERLFRRLPRSSARETMADINGLAAVRQPEALTGDGGTRRGERLPCPRDFYADPREGLGDATILAEKDWLREAYGLEINILGHLLVPVAVEWRVLAWLS